MDVVVFAVEVEWSPSGDTGESADEDVPNAVFKWLRGRLWERWRSLYVQTRQVSEFGTSVVHCVVLSVLVLVEHTQWVAGVTDWSVGPSSTEEAHRTWVYCTDRNPLYITMCHVCGKPIWSRAGMTDREMTALLSFSVAERLIIYRDGMTVE